MKILHCIIATVHTHLHSTCRFVRQLLCHLQTLAMRAWTRLQQCQPIPARITTGNPVSILALHASIQIMFIGFFAFYFTFAQSKIEDQRLSVYRAASKINSIQYKTFHMTHVGHDTFSVADSAATTKELLSDLYRAVHRFPPKGGVDFLDEQSAASEYSVLISAIFNRFPFSRSHNFLVSRGQGVIIAATNPPVYSTWMLFTNGIAGIETWLHELDIVVNSMLTIHHQNSADIVRLLAASRHPPPLDPADLPADPSLRAEIQQRWVARIQEAQIWAEDQYRMIYDTLRNAATIRDSVAEELLAFRQTETLYALSRPRKFLVSAAMLLFVVTVILPLATGLRGRIVICYLPGAYYFIMLMLLAWWIWRRW